MTIIGKPFTDIISWDPHNNRVRYGDQTIPQRRNLNFGEVRQPVQNQDLGILPPKLIVFPIYLMWPTVGQTG